MNRLLAFIVVCLVGLVAAAGGTAAQESPDPVPPNSTIADGSYVVANDDENPNVSGEGNVQVHGDIETGGAGGDVVGDAAALAESLGAIPDHDTLINNVPPPDTDPSDNPPAAPSAPPAPPAPPADGVSETTVAEMSNDDGTASTMGETTPPPPPASDGTAPPPSDGVGDPSAGAPPAPVAAPSCADFAYWYDAQLAYEAAGGVAADPALVAAFDPDYDGIACEESMALQ